MCTEKIYNRFMKNALGSIAILGSGETSPHLVSVHRELLEILDNSSDAYMIDTPFGFQENANQFAEKIIEFYKVSLNIEMKLASYRKIEELNTKSFFKSIQLLENASFIFAGPGSPSYASKLWHGNEFEQTLKNHLVKGGNGLFASAAASTLGEHTLPVYEIYKVGQDPYWEKGLNILDVYGLSCTVVPHFNNAEGGNHDTSFSYVGENRMKTLLDISYTNILGIDEHTALIISGKKETFKVVLEFVVNEDSKVCNKTIKDLEFPRCAIIAGVIRDGKGYIVLGDFKILSDDRIVVCCLNDSINKIEKLF